MVKNLIKKAKNVGKKAGYAAQVGLSAGRLATRVANPINMAKTVINAKRGKGLVLPGSRYIGPGNPLPRSDAEARPTSQGDKVALQHDRDYDKYLKSGKVKAKDLYLGFSDADQRAMKAADLRDPGGLAVWAGMGAKKLLNKTGLTKRIRDKDVYGTPDPTGLKKKIQKRPAKKGKK